MTDNLDAFISQMQNEIYEDAKKEFGETVYNRWRNPLYMGRFDNPDAAGKVKGTCGDSMEIQFVFQDGRVEDARCYADGCAPSVVCASFAAELSIGKTPEEIMDITGETILEKTGGLPEDHEHCAFLAAETLHEAVNDFMVKSINSKNV